MPTDRLFPETDQPCPLCRIVSPGHLYARRGTNPRAERICSHHSIWELIRAGFTVSVEDTREEDDR